MLPSLEPVNPEIVSLGYWKFCTPVESAHVLSRLTDGVIVTEMLFKLQDMEWTAARWPRL